MRKIEFRGSKGHGYSAYCGPVRAEVRRTDGGWEGSYSGSPRIHNPWVRHPEGGRSRSCVCPRIVVGTFPTRREAAEAALREKLDEEKRDGTIPQGASL